MIRHPPRSTTLRDGVLLAIAALASVATSSPRQPHRGYPTWRVERPRALAGCTNLLADVVTSGKEGLGVVVLRESPRCDVRIERARVRIGTVSRDALGITGWDERETTYLGFVFDNEQLWNDGVRVGVLELVVTAEGTRRELTYPMFHAWDGWHPPQYVPPAPLPGAPPPMPIAVPPAGGE